GDVTRGDELRSAGKVAQTADVRGADCPAVRHRLSRRHSVTLPSRWHADHRRTLVEGPNLTGRDEPDRFGNARSKWTSADHDSGQALGGLEKLVDALLLAQPPDEQHVRWLLRFPDALGHVDYRRHDSDLPCAERYGRIGE